MIALPNLTVLGFSFVVVVVVFHDNAKRTQQEHLLGGQRMFKQYKKNCTIGEGGHFNAMLLSVCE